MKGTNLVILLAAAPFLFLPFGPPAFGGTIVVNIGPYESAQRAGVSEGQVTWGDGDLSDDTVCTECFAATELQRCLRRMAESPEGFPIADDETVPSSGDLIIIGGLRSSSFAARHASAMGVSQEALDALGPEGYVIRSGALEGRRVLIIAGGGRVGTLYGVYDLLHRLGVRWYAPGDLNEEVPPRTIAPLPEVNVSEKPAFLTRGFHAWENRGNTEFLLWMARNRLNYWCVEQEEKPLMHKLGLMLSGGGHVLTDYYLGPDKAYPYDHPGFAGDDGRPEDPYPVSPAYQGDSNKDGKLSYFEAHPEWYALRGGKRSSRIRGGFGDNFCTSNEHAMAEWTTNAVQDLVDGQYRDADVMNAWMLDVGKWCECASCKAQGAPTDRNLLVVHRYAQAIDRARREGRIHRPIRLLFLAYADVLEPPTRALPEDFDYDVCIANYFPIARCYVHSFADPGCSRNGRYCKHLFGWAVDPKRHYRGQIAIGEYYNVSRYKCLPICFMSTMDKDIPHYYAQGARHLHYMHCTTGNWGNKALTNWQMARQLWDPRTDCRLLWDDYFQGRYGPAAGRMREFYEGLESMLGNVTELKYALSGRLRQGADDLFPTPHLKYQKTVSETDDGPDLVEMVEHARRCRRILSDVTRMDLPDRFAHRVKENERLFTYGERTVLFYDALCRTHLLLGEGKKAEAKGALKDAEGLAELLRADTESAKLASSHANAPNALAASLAAEALDRLRAKLK